MKLARLLFILILMRILPATVNAQCTGSLKTLSYDTLVIGTGNGSYNFSTPQFNPSLGTLMSISIKTNVSVGFGFQVENLLTSSRSVTIGVNRYDYISSPVLSNSYFANSIQKNYGPYSLGAANAVAGSGSDYMVKTPFAFLNGNTVINDSIISSITGFMGYGNLAFSYYPSTYSVIPSNLVYSFTANDTARFSVTYYYCNTAILSPHIVDFTATKQANSIQLMWETANEEPGLLYEIQESNDGKNFEQITTMPSSPGANNSAGYNYDYPTTGKEKGFLYFRVKQTGSDGTVLYSEIRTVDLNENGQWAVFPNPARSFINLGFSHAAAKWQLDIFTASGVLLQSNTFFNTASAHLEFQRKLAAGIYFVRATDLQTMEKHVSSFAVMP